MSSSQIQLSPIDKLREQLSSDTVKGRFLQMLGNKTAGFISSIISVVSGSKGLMECDQRSVVSAAAIAAALDLPINPSLGFAHIVPYKGVAQFQMGWKGFIQLAMRTGQYRTLNVTTVLEGQIGKHNRFTGEMEFSEYAISEKVVGYLLYFKLNNGFEKYFYMTYDEVFRHAKKYSQSFKQNQGQWVDNFDAMALKTVAKLGLSKYGILSIEMQKAIETDQASIKDDGSVDRYNDNDMDYAEKTVDILHSDQKTTIAAPKATSSTKMSCSECSVVLLPSVSDASIKQFGKSLCIPCQRKVSSLSESKNAEKSIVSYEEQKMMNEDRNYTGSDHD